MSGWPWPLDGVQHWFESLWNWISSAAVNAVSVVFKWVSDAVSGVWNNIVGAVGNLWNSISSAVGGLWTSITSAFSNLWTGITGALGNIWNGIVSVTSNLWNSIATSLGGLWTSISGAVGNLWTSVSGALGNLWTNFTSFLGNVANGISEGINAVGSAVGAAVNTIGSWVSEALKGVVTAMGQALQGFLDWVWKGLQNIANAIVGFVSEHIITPLMGALNWIRDAIFNILRGLWASIEGFFGGHSPITPEEAAGFTVPLLLIGAGAGFGVSVMGAVGSLKALGSGIEARAISDFIKDAFALADVSSSIIMPIFRAAYGQPIQYYYNSIFRPAIPSTGQADQMLFEENITEEQWRRIYAYWGWSDTYIDAWLKTVWREPSQLVLRAMMTDPDVPETWIRKKLREIGFIGEDQDAIIAYGKRQAISDERKALASQVETDLSQGAIDEAQARADLSALRFTPEEIDYRVAKAFMIKDRTERKESLKALKPAVAKSKVLSESDLTEELHLGLTTPERFIDDLTKRGWDPEQARRKYTIETTPGPISPAELERRKRLAESKIARTTRRYDYVIARHDLQTSFIADMIEYLSGLEKPPATRITTLQAQLSKAAEEKALILEQRDAELAELQEELALVTAG